MARQQILPVSIPKEYDWVMQWLDDYKANGNNASQFVREAIVEKINGVKNEKSNLEKRIEKLEKEIRNKVVEKVIYVQKEESLNKNCSNSENSSIISNGIEEDLLNAVSFLDD
jgi:hypothetical protein